MGEPIDPDTLARLQDQIDRLQLHAHPVLYRSDLEALLAVARDHARIVANLEATRLGDENR